MKRYHFNIFLLMGFYFLGFQFPLAGQIKDKWNGSVTYNQKATGPFIKINHTKITLVITENRVTGMITSNSETVAGNLVMSSTCSGEGEGVLQRVDINETTGVYQIEFTSPRYTCIGSNNAGWSGTSDGTHGVTINGKMSETNRNLVTGTKTMEAEIGADMKGITTISWSLHRGPIDAVLIVSPVPNNNVDYNNWMPIATRDELRKGNTMDINLKVQKRNGGESPFKVSRFELKLSNTSMEKGTTLNFPLEPSGNQLPDLRLLPDKIAESIKADQSLEINSTDGKTGYFSIGSYDGGGWTTLTAVAVLDGGIRIEGTLFTPTGVKEIPIPKRNANSKIATAWLAKYGNPADTADNEISREKRHKGDGLSAYEEYRGFISQGKFTRFDPTKQELGLRGNISDIDLFRYGISMFEKATGIISILFDDTEIKPTRNLNNNASYANVVDQYALWIKTGIIREFENGVLRKVAGKAYGGPDIPKNITHIEIDTALVGAFFRALEEPYRMVNELLPFTESDFWGGVIAHEIAHGVNVYHHGMTIPTPQNDSAVENSVPPYIVRDVDGKLITIRTFHMAGAIGKPHTQQSGDLTCFMAYNPYFEWAVHDNILLKEFFQVPLRAVGTRMCTSARGTGINENGKYFGDADTQGNPKRGNCLGQIKFK